jgi:hypothetical protein
MGRTAGSLRCFHSGEGEREKGEHEQSDENVGVRRDETRAPHGILQVRAEDRDGAVGRTRR